MYFIRSFDNLSSNLCRDEQNADPEVALEFLAKHCQWAVVTLGPNGCIAKHGKEVSESLMSCFIGGEWKLLQGSINGPSKIEG